MIVSTHVTTLPNDRSKATMLTRAAAAEWTRLCTLRSTWWTLAAGATLMLAIGGAAGSGHSGTEPAPIWQAAQIAMVPAQFPFLLVAVLATTSEYATGAIRSTLQWVPNRLLLFSARAAVPVAFVTAVAVVLAAATSLVAWAFLGSTAEVELGDISASLLRIGLVVSFGGAVSVGLGLLLRNTAGSVTAIFLLNFVLVVTLGNSGVPWLVTISDHLPGRAIVSVLVVDDGGLSTVRTALVMVAWASAALTAGCWSLLRRDTT